MIRLTISNQCGGVAKTTTALTLARCLNDQGLRVLLIDADPQGPIAAVLALKPNALLHDLLIRRLALRECLVSVRPGLDIVCGNRYTTEAETTTMSLPLPGVCLQASSRGVRAEFHHVRLKCEQIIHDPAAPEADKQYVRSQLRLLQSLVTKATT